MKQYRIYCLDTAGHICSARSIQCQTDVDAIAAAANVCRENGAEVWEDIRLVIRTAAKPLPRA